MTDKQIIIDGIDVGGCIYYEDGKCLNGEMVQCNCKKVAVCYYKEYKRKEQECEELKRQHQGDKGLITSTGKMNYQLIQEYDKLKTENDELKETFDGLFKVQYKLADNNKKLRQCLTEIKEIAENFYLDGEHVKDKYLAQDILQKISEVTND
jgi:hypothetical protein